jgi:hypothetical protein
MAGPEKAYPVRLAGTRSYFAAIGRATAGDAVTVLREAGNPYDADALVVVDGDGSTLGYIPRDNWLRRALVDEGKGCRATVEDREAVSAAVWMTIAVTLTDDAPIGGRDFAPAD